LGKKQSVRAETEPVDLQAALPMVFR
jgi:hypothetical protein